jgi:hypothetical protein
MMAKPSVRIEGKDLAMSKALRGHREFRLAGKSRIAEPKCSIRVAIVVPDTKEVRVDSEKSLSPSIWGVIYADG